MTRADTMSPPPSSTGRSSVSNPEESKSAFASSPATNGPVRVRKRRSRGSFILFLSVFLVISALKSTYGENKSQTQHHPTNHHQGTNSHTTPPSTPVHHGGKEEGEGHHESQSHSLHHSSTTERPAESTHHSSHHHHTSTTPASDDLPILDENSTSIWGNKCIKPAIEQFPPTIMGPGLRKNGGFIFHVAVAAYTFLALAIICDEFFVPSLEKMCDVLKMQPDVAGATFMAAGSSAPELATALIGVFIAKDDIGVSGVIGSAVFNIMFVIAICGLMTPTVLYLNWWPLVRDCFFYMLSILALLFCIYDEKIEWYESIFLLLLYALYIWAMYMNTVLEAYFSSLPIPYPVHDPTVLPVPPSEKSGLVTFKAVPGQEQIQGGYGDDEYSGGGGLGGELGLDPPNKVPMPPVSILTQFNPPEGSSGFKQVLWRISLPLVYLFYYTVPDCRLEQWRSWYVITFTMAMVWIAVFSYVMVWMITVVGFTLGVPDTVMGLTFVAAGVSVPDALSSLAVMKEGYGDMAVSNAVGSNVFDILICLGLPWFLATVVINPGDTVQVISKGLTYSTLSLLSTVAFLLIATHYNKWQLNKTYGVVLMLWYLLFMILASLYELNVFGEFNPPECDSLY